MVQAHACTTTSGLEQNRAHPSHQKEKGTIAGPNRCEWTVVPPSAAARLLCVIFDEGLRRKEHVQQAIKRVTKVTIALRGLRHLRPEQMGQLYRACVAQVVDYASTVWHDPLRAKSQLRHLNTV
jgi:hypothetical protein